MAIDLNKHIITNDSHSLFHTSGYAQVANGSTIGAVNSQTFQQRQQIEQNRQIVGSYSRSTMGQSYAAMRARPVLSREATRPGVQSRGIIPQRSIGVGQPHFSEPRGRVYNPYG